MMRASIITVCCNSRNTIEDTIRSVLAQEYEDVEYIVVDSCSTDGTRDIMAKYEGRVSKYISELDNGIYDAMNKGIRASQGKIIGFLNAGDVYANSGVISEVMSLIKDHGLDAAYGDLVYVDKRNTGKVVRYWQTEAYTSGGFSYGWVPPHPTFFCRKGLFEEFGYFNTGFQVAADFELMLRFIEKHRIKIAYVPKTLVHMRVGGKANTIQGIVRGNREIIDAFSLNGLKLPVRFFWRKPLLKVAQFVKRPVAEGVG